MRRHQAIDQTSRAKSLRAVAPYYTAAIVGVHDQNVGKSGINAIEGQYACHARNDACRRIGITTVEKRDRIAGSAAQPFVEGVVRSGVRLGNQASYAAIMFMYHVHGGVRRPAIDQYMLNLFVVLLRNGL